MDCRATTECEGKSVHSIIRWYVSSWMTMHQSINSQHSSVYCKIPDPVCILCDKPSTLKRIKVNGYPVLEALKIDTEPQKLNRSNFL